MIDNTTKEKALGYLRGMVEKVNHDLLFIQATLAAFDLTQKEKELFEMLITETLIGFVYQDYLEDITS